MKHSIILFVDDFSKAANVTEFNDLVIPIHDVVTWKAPLLPDLWDMNTVGYNIGFDGPTGTFVLELTIEGIKKLQDSIARALIEVKTIGHA